MLLSSICVSVWSLCSKEGKCLSWLSIRHKLLTIISLLDELDEDLLLELDDVVQDNQLACLPIARSGRAEADLLDRHPELPALIDRERRAKVDSIILHSKYQDVDMWGPSSFRGQSFDDAFASPSQQKQRRKSSRDTGGLSPALRGKSAVQSLGASIEEDVALDLGEPAVKSAASEAQRHLRKDTAMSTPSESWLDNNNKSKLASPTGGTPTEDDAGMWPTPLSATPASSSKVVPWAATPSPGAKLDMRDIMAQTSSTRVSNLSLGIAASRAEEAITPGPASTTAAGSFKLSQKERRRMQLEQQERVVQADQIVATKSASPWQKVQKGQTLKDIMSGESSRQPSPKAVEDMSAVPRASPKPQLTMRQTIANPKPALEEKNVVPMNISPAQQKRSVSGPVPNKAVSSGSSNIAMPQPMAHRPAASPRLTAAASPHQRPSLPQTKPSSKHQQTAAHLLSPSPPPDLTSQSFPNLIASIQHNPKSAEPSLQLSMQEILDQQQREKDIIREAREAKRNLQDIQAEQEFQEWWDREAARMREDEEFARLVGEGKEPKEAKGAKPGARGGKRGTKSGGPSAEKSGRGRGGGGGGGGGQAAKDGHNNARGGSKSGSSQNGGPRGGGNPGRGRGGAAATAAVRGKGEATV